MIVKKNVMKKSRFRENSFLDLIKIIEPELILWVIALAALAFIDPYGEQHYSLCFFRNLGFDFCPGCGLGRSIGLLYRGELDASLNAHPLGAIALGVILARIVRLFKRTYRDLINKSGVRHGRPISITARNTGR
jgi:hypothetical protein